MEKVFLEILNMSITAGYCVIAVVLLRLLMKKLPKIYSYVLWAVVFFRLVCPVSIKSVFSFFKFIPVNFGMQRIISTESGGVISAAGNNVQANTGVVGGNTSDVIGNVINNATNITNNDIPVNVSGSVATEAADAAANAGFLEVVLQNIITISAIVWITVALGLIIYSILSAVRLKSKLKNAVHIEANIYEAAGLETPFVFGLIRPQIYFPDSLKEPERSFVQKHELTHLRRKDYIIKQAAFFVVCIHWFNPLAWLAFYLMSKDMEMSCDESVIARLCREEKADYSHALLTLASKKKGVGLSPLAFGEGNVKGRIKNVLSYKKPMLWVTVVIIIVLAVVIIGLGANPEDKKGEGEQQEIEGTDNSEALENEAESEAETIDIGENGTIDISEIEADNNPEEVIKAYTEYMGNDWNSFAMLHKSEVAREYIVYLNASENSEHKAGLLNVKSAKLLELVEIDFKKAEPFIGGSDSKRTVKTYAACIDYSTYENNWDYANGIEYDVISVILEDGEWKISEVVNIDKRVSVLVNGGCKLSEEYVEAAVEKARWEEDGFEKGDLLKKYRGDAVKYYDIDENIIDAYKLEYTNTDDFDIDNLIEIDYYEQADVTLYRYEVRTIDENGDEYITYNLVLEYNGMYQVFEETDDNRFLNLFGQNSLSREAEAGYEADCDGDGELELLTTILQEFGSNGYTKYAIAVFDFNNATGVYDFYCIEGRDLLDSIDEAVRLFIDEYYGDYSVGEHGDYVFEDGNMITFSDNIDIHRKEDGSYETHTTISTIPQSDRSFVNGIGTVVLNVRYVGDGKFAVKADSYKQWEENAWIFH